MRTLLALLLLTAPALAQPKEFTVKLPAERWDFVQKALQDVPRPFKDTYPLLLEIAKQIEAQQKAEAPKDDPAVR